MEKNKTVVIIGASSGMGADMARSYATLGYQLVLAARRHDKLLALKEEILKSNSASKIEITSCDVNSDDDVKKLFHFVREKFSSIDIVVANAGFGVAGTIEDLTLENFQNQFETNVYGVIRAVKESMQDIIKAKGTYVLMGSVLGHLTIPGQSAYCMSKYAVRSFADSLRHELKAYQVSVLHVSPGLIATEFRQNDGAGQFDAKRKDYIPAFAMMSSPAAAKKIVKASLQRKSQLTLTCHGKLAVFFERKCPWFMRTLIGLFSKTSIKLAKVQQIGA